MPGLGVRVTDKGAKSFVLHARYPGSPHATRRLLSMYGDLSLEAAREKARAWRVLISEGRDPADEAARRRQEARQRPASTFGAVAEAYIVDIHQQKQRKAPQVARRIRNEFVTRWADRTIGSITSDDVLDVVDAAKKRGAFTQAHHLLADIRTLFNWALGRSAYDLTGSPCDRLKPKKLIGKRAKRKRVLTDDELRAFWKAAGALPYAYGPLFQLMALTMQRESEVAQAVRSEIDPDAALWTMPPGRMKGRRRTPRAAQCAGACDLPVAP